MVLASDSRGTFGDPRAVTAQNDTMIKVYALSKYAGALLSGGGELGAMIINEARARIQEEKREGATSIMEVMREILIRRFNEWFPGFLIQPVQGSLAPVRPALTFIIGGYDVDKDGKPTTQRIYTLNCYYNFAPFLHDYGFALDGVAQYALYLLNRMYNPNLELGSLTRLASYVIVETATQDGKVGGPVQMLKILPNEGCVLLGSEEIKTIITSNYKRA